METALQSEHVLDGVYDARFAGAALAADVLEMLPTPFFLQPCAALVKKRRW